MKKHHAKDDRRPENCKNNTTLGKYTKIGGLLVNTTPTTTTTKQAVTSDATTRQTRRATHAARQ